VIISARLQTVKACIIGIRVVTLLRSFGMVRTRAIALEEGNNGKISTDCTTSGVDEIQ